MEAFMVKDLLLVVWSVQLLRLSDEGVGLEQVPASLYLFIAQGLV
jgi:hypothetical protein